MNAWRQFLFRLRETLRSRRHNIEMDEELRHHVELRIELYIASGMPADEARCAALRAFGGIEQIKERARDARRLMWLDQLWQDLDYAARTLRRNLVFAMLAILSIALGIGPNVVIFSLINDRLLKPLPVEKPTELILFEWVNQPRGQGPPWSGDVGTPDKDPATGQPGVRLFSRDVFEAFNRNSQPLREVFATAPYSGATVTIDGQGEIAQMSELVSGNYFEALGIHAIRGRLISPADDRPGAPPAAVLSYRYWKSRFGKDPSVIGKVIATNGLRATVIGVTKEGFDGTMLGGGMTSIMLPLSFAPLVFPHGSPMAKPSFSWLRILGRLRPGVSFAQVQHEMEPVYRSAVRPAVESEKDIPVLRVVPGGTGWSQGDRRLFTVFLLPLLGMVSLILMTACANLANLLLARGVARRGEIATRLALGAGRGRIVRQLLAENFLIAIGGSLLGVIFATWTLQFISGLLPAIDRPLLARVVIDWRVILAAAVTAITTGAIFGLTPALRSTRLDLRSEIQGESKGVRAQSKSKLSRTLITIQVAVAFVLLVFAGLFVRTLRNLNHADLGFDPRNMILFSTNIASTVNSTDRQRILQEEVAESLKAIPGVRAVSYSNWGFVAGEGGGRAELSVPGAPTSESKTEVTYNRVGAGFFGTYGIRLLSGREFAVMDQAGAAKVAVVNQAFVRKYLAGAEPLQRFIEILGDRQIVGVVEDVKQVAIRDVTAPTVFIPFGQDPGFGATQFAVRLENGNLSEISRAVVDKVRAVNPALTVGDLRTQEEQVARSLTGERFLSNLASYLGFLALVLSSVGLFGLVSYGVLQRQREIGVRMALGARPRSILAMIFLESFPTIAIGLAVGLLAAFFLTKIAAGILFGMSSSNPITYAAVVVILVGVAGFACGMPALRAARISPMRALRAE